ncbi:MAG: hypothetical protein A3G25_17365 [Betaproteobacteria bacterium RIFCSPLOWO2_12_FULL_63_13]|nr:MAG: hypothetical protein A3G25_17365 [Betaproteobacteria bacterium RIFCSPLOWO2_12_FULL_63_13]
MELLHNLETGFVAALTLQNLLYCFVGCFLGTLIGVLPGLGPVATIAMLLPVTYTLPPTAALIMLAGIYYGAQYGGSTTAILINLPGESSSVVTAIDGYQMARNGRAGVALFTAGAGSFVAGCIGVLILAGFAVPLVDVAFEFGPTEYAALMTLGLVGATILSSGSLLKAIGMVIIGLLLGLVGTDTNGAPRYSFGIDELSDGIGFVAIAMGVFGVAEIIGNVEKDESRSSSVSKITSMWPTRADIGRMVPAVLRGTAIGAFFGILPGAGAAVASFSSYAMEKKISSRPEEFGKGAIEGVAGPEAANNAAAQTAFIPLLTLGLPASATMAMMLGAMTIHDIQPGPQVMASDPALFWGLIVSMWIGNLILIVLNLPMIGMWVKLLAVPYRALYPAILVFCSIGVYTVSNSDFDIYLVCLFGAVGYLFSKLNCEPAPLLLGFVLGPLMEENFRRALLLSDGDFSVFLTRPIPLVLLVITGALLASILLPAFRRTREKAFVEN